MPTWLTVTRGWFVPGMIEHRLDTAINRNNVPRKARYFLGLCRPTSSICSWIVVTTISRRPCQREICTFGLELGVTSLAPTAITSINPQVVTMVLLSLTNPYFQKTSSSGLKRIAGLLFQWCTLPLSLVRAAARRRHER